MAGDTMRLEIATPGRLIFSEPVHFLSAPGIAGVLGIYPHHCPLLTILQAGELKIQKENGETFIAIGGGFMEVRNDKVIILADMAERDDEISEQQAVEAKKRAEQALTQKNITDVEREHILGALRLEIVRLNVVEKRKKRENHPTAVNDPVGC
jgi:F-type H+-transporting ATPase subunit epsilon